MLTRYVNTASSAGGDGTTNATSGTTRAFATLREALDAIGASLSDAMTIYCSGGEDTGDLDSSPWDFTTTATNYLLITTQGDQRPNGVWSESKYYLHKTNGNGLYQNLSMHTRIDGLQIKLTVTNAGSYVALKTTNANQTSSGVDMRVSNCIVKAVRTSGDVIGFQSRPFGSGGSGKTGFWNCMAIDCTSGFVGEGVAAKFYNCGAYDCTYGFVEDAAGPVLKNCISDTNGSTIGFVGTWTGSDYNAENDGNGAPGANSRSGTTFSFKDAANDDFRLTLADAGARNYGTDLSGDADFPFSDDIGGQTRSGTWDIGPDEANLPTAALTGTATASITEADIVAGGKTVILTLTDDTWVPAAGTPTYNAATTKGTTAADSAGGGGGRTGDGALSCTFPSGYTPTAGHFALMVLYNDQGDGSTPTDWTEVSGSPWGSGTPKLCAFYKVLAGGESAPSTTISGSTTNASHCAGMVIYTGVGSIGAVGTASDGTGTPMTAGAVTTTANNSIVIAISGRGDNENASGQTFNSLSTGVNERLDGGTAAGNDSQVSAADITIATSGTSSGSASATTSITDPWVSVQLELVASTPFADARSAIASGLDSAQSEAAGWDAKVKPNIPVGNVVRTSDTVCTITLQAQADYNITAQETITATIPAAGLTGAAQIVASPTFTIDTSASLSMPWARTRRTFPMSILMH